MASYTPSAEQIEASNRWSEDLAAALAVKDFRFDDFCRFACPICAKSASDTAGWLQAEVSTGKVVAGCHRCDSDTNQLAQAVGLTPPWLQPKTKIAKKQRSSSKSETKTETKKSTPAKPKISLEDLTREALAAKKQAEVEGWTAASIKQVKSLAEAMLAEATEGSREFKAAAALKSMAQQAEAEEGIEDYLIEAEVDTETKISAQPAAKPKAPAYPEPKVIWQHTDTLLRTPAYEYLKNRLAGLPPEIIIKAACPSNKLPKIPLRWLPKGKLAWQSGTGDLTRWQPYPDSAGCMVAKCHKPLLPFQPEGEVAAVSLTRLAANGRVCEGDTDKRRLMCKPYSKNGIVCLLAEGDTANLPVLVAEGIETALAAAALMAAAGSECGGIAVAIDAGNLPHLAGWLSGLAGGAVIVADDDENGKGLLKANELQSACHDKGADGVRVLSFTERFDNTDAADLMPAASSTEAAKMLAALTQRAEMAGQPPQPPQPSQQPEKPPQAQAAQAAQAAQIAQPASIQQPEKPEKTIEAEIEAAKTEEHSSHTGLPLNSITASQAASLLGCSPAIAKALAETFEEAVIVDKEAIKSI